MSDSKTKLGFFLLALAIVIGALGATFFMHYALNNGTSSIDLGDSTHGYLKVQSEKNGLADISIDGQGSNASNSDTATAGSLTRSLGNIN